MHVEYCMDYGLKMSCMIYIVYMKCIEKLYGIGRLMVKVVSWEIVFLSEWLVIVDYFNGLV
jgi:hypothetical protein